MNRLINWLKKPSSDRTLLVILIILLNLVSIRGFLRFDLTNQKAYSISKASKDVVKHIDAPLSIKVFFSKDLPAPYNNVEQYLTDILYEYKANASKDFSYQIYDVSKMENQEIARSFQIEPIQIDTVETTGFSSRLAWMGLVITYGDFIAPINALKTTNDLEYKITTTISKIISVQDAKNDKLFEIGYITGHNENPLHTNPYAQSYSEMGSGNLNAILSDIYSVKTINLPEEDIPSSIKTVIINGARAPFTQEELYKIDQFIMKGGNILFFISPLEEYFDEQQRQVVYTPGNTGLEKLIEAYGITLENSIIMDEKCLVQNQSEYGKQIVNWVPVVEKDSLDKKNPISQNLGGLYFFENGPMDISKAIENPELTATVLAKSSKNSWTVKDNIYLFPGYMAPPMDRSVMKSENLAVLLEGSFTSAMKDYKADGFVEKSPDTTKIMVVSSGLVTTDALIDREGNSPIALFVRNAVDYLNGNPDFCTMRTKGTRLDFITIKSERFATIIKFLNIFGLAVVVILTGFIIWHMRATRRYFIHQRYNPNDNRLVEKKSKKEDKDND